MTLRTDLANIGIAVIEERDGLLLLRGTANKRKASVSVSLPDAEALAEAKRQIASNMGTWPEVIDGA